jgi:hypothetical protein
VRLRDFLGAVEKKNKLHCWESNPILPAPWGQTPPCPLQRSLSGPQKLSGRYGEKKIITLREMEYEVNTFTNK